MTRKALLVKSQKEPKYKVRKYSRCSYLNCGRSKSVFRKYGVCRIHFREIVSKGYIPGFVKSSW
jgi:small subunit ribosomal protein S14